MVGVLPLFPPVHMPSDKKTHLPAKRGRAAARTAALSAGGALVGSKSTRRREAIVAHATELFDREGYLNTSLDDVAQAVGLTREALYYYFRNRSEILLAIIEPQAASLIDGLKAIVDGPAPSAEKLRMAVRNHLERFDLHCLEMTITLRDGVMGTGDPVRGAMVRIWKKYERMWIALVVQGQASGEFSNSGDPKMVAFGILGMCNWLARWYDPKKKTSIDEIIRTFSDLVSNGLVAVSPSSEPKRS